VNDAGGFFQHALARLLEHRQVAALAQMRHQHGLFTREYGAGHEARHEIDAALATPGPGRIA
jgi:hypothetical protein